MTPKAIRDAANRPWEEQPEPVRLDVCDGCNGSGRIHICSPGGGCYEACCHTCGGKGRP